MRAARRTRACRAATRESAREPSAPPSPHPTPAQGATSKGVFVTAVSFGPGGATLFSPDAPAVMDEVNNNTIEGALALAQVWRGTIEGTRLLKHGGGKG